MMCPCWDNNRAKKYSVWLLDSYVSGTSTLSWCPGVGCERAVEGTASTLGVSCGCGYDWCFRCKIEDHAPATCQNAKDWNLKNSSDAENVNWVIHLSRLAPTLTRVALMIRKRWFDWIDSGEYKDLSQM
jgi:ariadne-1